MLPAALLLALCSPLGTAPGQDGLAVWPQWRGPTRDGRVAGPRWPERLDEDRLVVSWRAGDLGPSYAGPIVGDELVYTVESLEGERECVRAFDRASGEPRWSATWEGAMKVPFFAASRGSWVRSTPAWDGESLFVAGMRDVLVCLDARTGELRWKVDFVERLGTDLPAFGCVCSPLVVGDHVYVQAGSSFLDLDKQTGETLWRTLVEGGGMDSAFSSPVLAELSGRRQLLVQTRTRLAGVSEAGGEVLWSTPIEAFRGMNILTPLPFGDSVFTSAYGGKGQLVDVGEGPEGLLPSTRWQNRAQGYMTSPVLVDGHAYLFLRSNRFTCVDLASGEQPWISPPTEDEYWSLVAQADRILALSDDGRLRLIAADPAEYRVLSEVQLPENDTWAHLAVAGNELYVRSIDALVALRWERDPAERRP